LLYIAMTATGDCVSPASIGSVGEIALPDRNGPRGSGPKVVVPAVAIRQEDGMDMVSFGGQYYLDDRMFVVGIESVDASAGRDVAPLLWALVTRRNVPGYALFRQRVFASREQAIAVLRQLAPRTPRLSLHGLSPVPAPTYEQYNAWLREQGLAPLAY